MLLMDGETVGTTGAQAESITHASNTIATSNLILFIFSPLTNVVEALI
jgi:hypothetical protein